VLPGLPGRELRATFGRMRKLCADSVVPALVIPFGVFWVLQLDIFGYNGIG
jgi:hypothetical protein